eukprot:7019677-Prymnesium_polylepis.1
MAGRARDGLASDRFRASWLVWPRCARVCTEVVAHGNACIQHGKSMSAGIVITCGVQSECEPRGATC